MKKQRSTNWGQILIGLGVIVTFGSLWSGSIVSDWVRIGSDPSYAGTVLGGVVRFVIGHGLWFILGGGLLLYRRRHSGSKAEQLPTGALGR